MYLYNKISVAICDDEQFFAENTSELCQRVLLNRKMTAHVDVFLSPLKLLRSEVIYDVVFLDIDMPDLDGLTAASRLQEKNNHVKIVFLTSHDEFMRHAFKLRAYRYLMKPCRSGDIEEVLLSVFEELLTVKVEITDTSGVTHYPVITQIHYLESLGEGAAVYLDKMHILQTKPLKYWEKKFPDLLVRVHKSYLVNLSYVKSLQDSFVVMENSRQIPVSVRKRTMVKKCLQAFIRKQAAYFTSEGKYE